MFLPTLQGKHELAHLGSGPVSALTKEYRSDMTELRESIVQVLAEREKSGPALHSGPQLAKLIELLVDGANSGELKKVPSLWAGFLELQIKEAKTTAAEYHLANLTKEVGRTPPRAEPELQKISAAITSASEMLYSQLLVGLESDDAKAGAKGLVLQLQRQRQHAASQNIENIRKYVTRHAKDFLDTFRKEIRALPSPQPSKELTELISPLLKKATNGVDKVTKPYDQGGGSIGLTMSTQHHQDLQRSTKDCEAANRQKLRKVLEQGKKSAEQVYLDVFTQLLIARGERCVTDTLMASRDREATSQAMQRFKDETAVASTEVDAALFVSHTKEALRGRFGAMEARNTDCVLKFVSSQRETLQRTANRKFLDTKLPLGQEHLDNLFKQHSANAVAEYKANLADFAKSAAFKQGLGRLQADLVEEHGVLIRRNEQAVKDLVEYPLRKAKQQLSFEAEGFWLSFTFRKHCHKVALHFVNEKGSLPKEFYPYLDGAIESWIATEMALQVNSVVFRTYQVIVGVGTALVAITMGVSYMSRQQTTESC